MMENGRKGKERTMTTQKIKISHGSPITVFSSTKDEKEVLSLSMKQYTCELKIVTGLPFSNFNLLRGHCMLLNSLSFLSYVIYALLILIIYLL